MKKSTETDTAETPRIEQPRLALLADAPSEHQSWVLDEQTRKTGREGLAKARAALRATRPAHLDAAA